MAQDKPKTNKDLVDACNELARQLYALHGYQVPKGYRFDAAHHPQERSMWTLAVAAYDHIEGTDIEDALAQAIGDGEIEEE